MTDKVNQNTELQETNHSPWAQPAQAVLDALDVEAEQGLARETVRRRRKEYGKNRLRHTARRSAWQILYEQFKSLVVLLLIVAAGISLAFGEWIDAAAIAAVVVINAAIGFVTELRAVRSMEALQELSNVTAKVRRTGQVSELPAEELVPGDIVVLEGGDLIAADLRLIEASNLQADESALTGESVPVAKQLEALAPHTPLAERTNMAFKGAAITRGAGEGVVVATGMQTELGNISALVEEAEAESTPLEERLDQLGRKLVWVTLVVAAVVAVIGILRQRDLLLMVETSIALAVAAIPEGLPIVATIALARGMRRMAQRNALINRLAAVETLGGTRVICTDKTGTLTENQMTLVRYLLPEGEITVTGEGLKPEGEFRANGATVDPHEDQQLRRSLVLGMLCNDASVESSAEPDGAQTGVGDPLEVALLIAGAKAGMVRAELLEEHPEVKEVAFDPDIKMMATYHANRKNGTDDGDAGYTIAVKGAPEAVLANCSRIQTDEGSLELSDAQREEWRAQNERLGEDGLRLLGLATKQADNPDADPYTDLSFVGLVGLLDPPREEVEAAIEDCHRAGIRVVMVTGDQPATARNVALAVGLVDEEDPIVLHGEELQAQDGLSDAAKERLLDSVILARVSPEQKLDLINYYQEQGLVVAMTGDGVNDAPALKKADIGVAMGQRGTQVAREAADMVLEDDAFASIVVAVRQGRTIFTNIRKFVLYLLSCNISEIMTVGVASLLRAPLPILPLQILFLNLVTDVFPALALGVGEGDPEAMERPPRDLDEPIMMQRHWRLMGGYGLLITAAVLGALGLALGWFGMTRERAVTVSFLTLAFAQLWHVFNMREPGVGFLQNDIVRNPYVWGALALCTGLILLAVYLPPLANVLSVVHPGATGWALILSMSFVPLVIGQILKIMGVGKI